MYKLSLKIYENFLLNLIESSLQDLLVVSKYSYLFNSKKKYFLAKT